MKYIIKTTKKIYEKSSFEAAMKLIDFLRVSNIDYKLAVISKPA